MMANKEFKHSDCKNFTAVDVVKGFCRLKNELVFIDTPVCKKFEELPKCKNCANFLDPDDKGVGTCKCSKKGFWAYEDNIAVTCEGYQAK